MQLFTQAFNYASEPFFFKQAHTKDAQQTYADVARAFTLVGSFAFLFILFYLDILQLILGENFRGGLRVIPILLLAYLFLGLYYNFSVWYKIMDKTKVGAVIAVIGAMISISINIYLIPKMGIIASAWAALAAFTSYAIMGYVAGRIYYPIPYRLDKILGMIGLAVGFYYLGEWLNNYFSLLLISRLIINTLLLFIYCVIIWIWEKNFYKRILES
jgi:O-antigen/teichoic acid export membrane protein